MRVLFLPEVAEALGVSATSARRALAAYERVSGEPLPRNKRGEWAVPEGVVAHLEAAHALVRERRVPWEVALSGVLGKEAPPLLARKGELPEVLARLHALEEENRALRTALEEQRRLLEEQNALLTRVARALEEEGKRKRPWWKRWSP